MRLCQDQKILDYSVSLISSWLTKNELLKYFIQDIIKQRTNDIELKKYAVKLLEEFGSFEYTKQTLKLLEKS